MPYDVVIIGGGVVGLSILRSSLLAGYDAVLVERNADLCDGASGRNSGILCTGVDAPSGSLERALIRDSISRVREFCSAHNVPARECGSLVCLWPWDDDGDADEKKGGDTRDDELTRASLKHVLHESHVAGDGDACFLSSDEVRRLEPSLSSACRGAVHIPGEMVVDPWLFPLALAAHSRELAERNGIERDVIHTGREVLMNESSFDDGKGLWNIVTRRTMGDIPKGSRSAAANHSPIEIPNDALAARCVINAAGIDSDLVQISASSATRGNVKKPLFMARPRRGQYVVFSAANGSNAAEPRTVLTRPVQPVPSQFTKGIFVYSTLYDQIVVGPTARDQWSRTDDVPDVDVAHELAAHASRVLGSDFDASEAVGEYVGIRPGTSGRDYQIHLHCRSNFVTVGGIRSTGLTASLGIGRHVVQCILPAFLSHSMEGKPWPRPDGQLPPTPLPDVRDLANQYRMRGDGRIVVRGHAYRVTHPLTRMGWNARTGIAA